MSDAERRSYRSAMQSLESNEERERLRNAIHEAMKARARDQGLLLPDEPPAPPGMRRGNCAGAQGLQHGKHRPPT
jgi:hypothetical protein